MLLFLMLSIVLESICPTIVQNKFDYLKVSGNRIESVHKIKHVLKIDNSFKLLGEYHHQPTYDKKMFNVSVAAYSKDDAFVMVHAEAHTDDSGGLDYSNLKAEPLNGINFTSREQCETLAEIPDPDSIPDLRFLKNNGFALGSAIFLKQYFTTSADGSSEYVLTYGKRVTSCESNVITNEFKAQIKKELQTVLEIRKK
jgi:hypothetical protein